MEAPAPGAGSQQQPAAAADDDDEGDGADLTVRSKRKSTKNSIQQPQQQDEDDSNKVCIMFDQSYFANRHSNQCWLVTTVGILVWFLTVLYFIKPLEKKLTAYAVDIERPHTRGVVMCCCCCYCC